MIVELYPELSVLVCGPFAVWSVSGVASTGAILADVTASFGIFAAVTASSAITVLVICVILIFFLSPFYPKAIAIVTDFAVAVASDTPGVIVVKLKVPLPFVFNT